MQSAVVKAGASERLTRTGLSPLTGGGGIESDSDRNPMKSDDPVALLFTLLQYS